MVPEVISWFQMCFARIQVLRHTFVVPPGLVCFGRRAQNGSAHGTLNPFRQTGSSDNLSESSFQSRVFSNAPSPRVPAIRC